MPDTFQVDASDIITKNKNSTLQYSADTILWKAVRKHYK